MFTTTVLKRMPYAQAKVRHYDNGVLELISYRTSVITLDTDGWMSVSGLYSATTRRHIGAFMREFTEFGYATAKYIYEQGCKFNIYTGEIIE